MLLIKSADPLGANYVVLRDTTVDGQPNQQFFYNLWCLSKDPSIAGNTAHFPGQFGVDLDLHVLSPAAPQFEKDQWKWEQYIGPWANFTEEQYGVRVMKQGSAEDFFTVLYPRAAGQTAAQVTALAQGAAARVVHMEGTDVVLLSPGKPVEAGPRRPITPAGDTPPRCCDRRDRRRKRRNRTGGNAAEGPDRRCQWRPPRAPPHGTPPRRRGSPP